jgi:hypothetical protein
MIVARIEGYTYAVKVWALCLVQRAISLSPRAKPHRYDSHLSHRCTAGVGVI